MTGAQTPPHGPHTPQERPTAPHPHPSEGEAVTEPQNVPDELIELAGEALYNDAHEDCGGDDGGEFCCAGPIELYRHRAEIALAAVIARHEAMVRAKIAEEIGKQAKGLGRASEYGLGYGNGLDRAEEIARGETRD